MDWFLYNNDLSLERVKVLNNQEEYFRRCEKMRCMIFLNNTLITLSHIVFNISLGLIYDQCHILYAKPQVCFGNY